MLSPYLTYRRNGLCGARYYVRDSCGPRSIDSHACGLPTRHYGLHLCDVCGIGFNNQGVFCEQLPFSGEDLVERFSAAKDHESR